MSPGQSATYSAMLVNGDRAFNMLDASADEKDDPRNIKTGDQVTVEMLTIDEPVLKFWRSLRSGGGSGNGFSAAPANPVTNIEGGALGYSLLHVYFVKSRLKSVILAHIYTQLCFAHSLRWENIYSNGLV